MQAAVGQKTYLKSYAVWVSQPVERLELSGDYMSIMQTVQFFDAKCMEYKEIYGQNFTQSDLTLILKLKVTKQIFFGMPYYDFLYVGNVPKSSILKIKRY